MRLDLVLPGMAACGPSHTQASGSPVQRSFASVLAGASDKPDAIALGEVSTFRGEPALRISRREIEQLSEPFQNSLVGRFSFNRPPMEVIRKFFLSLGLRGDCKVGLLDHTFSFVPFWRKTTPVSLRGGFGMLAARQCRFPSGRWNLRQIRS